MSAGIRTSLAFLRTRLSTLAAVQTALGVATSGDALARIVSVRAEPTTATTTGAHLVLYRPRLSDRRDGPGTHTVTAEITVEAAFPPATDPDAADGHLDAMAAALRASGDEDWEVDLDGVVTEPGAPVDADGDEGQGWAGWHRGALTVRFMGAA
jgi:hypothetical protein